MHAEHTVAVRTPRRCRSRRPGGTIVDNRAMPLLLGTDAEAVGRAAHLVREGRVVAYPTDTLYGLAVDPRNAPAVRRLFALKGRPESSALTLIAADLAQAEAAGEFGAVAARLAAAWWPGPLTIVVTARPLLAPETLANGATVGIRVPDHAAARALARACGFCITATSANRSGMPPAVTVDEVASMLPDVDAAIDGGRVRGGAPSTIVAIEHERARLLRDGAIAWDRVLKSLQ
jgi:L-threonylcarbamoyladenylate synthase